MKSTAYLNVKLIWYWFWNIQFEKLNYKLIDWVTDSVWIKPLDGAK